MQTPDKLDISDVKKGAHHFYEALEHMQEIEETLDKTEFMYRFSRGGLIKVYENTIELSWKIMQRWIKLNDDVLIHEKPKRELFRSAHQAGLIDDPVLWWTFYEARNKTAHTYHEETAEYVYGVAKDFRAHLQQFIIDLEKRV